MKKENIIKDKTYEFALQVVKVSQDIINIKREFVLSRQILRSGTAIGALAREAEHAESKADFIHKMNIALKEANETDYWVDLLYGSDYISKEIYNKLKSKITEILKLLISIIKTSKQVKQV